MGRRVHRSLTVRAGYSTRTGTSLRGPTRHSSNFLLAEMAVERRHGESAIRCDRWCYHGAMPAMKRSVAFDPEVWKEAEAAAREECRSLSAMVNEALREHLALRQGLRSMELWQAEHGAFTGEELAAADEALDRALRSGR